MWSLAESVSFLPMSLLIQSFCRSSPPPVEVMPGTTRGIFDNQCCVILKMIGSETIVARKKLAEICASLFEC